MYCSIVRAAIKNLDRLVKLEAEIEVLTGHSLEHLKSLLLEGYTLQKPDKPISLKEAFKDV